MSVAALIVSGVTTALYRRYRPETFEDVIGQEHVTGPLMAAISGGRVSHAYLFSGPRGCGKTTSARILARCLNCAQGPTPTPCGECDSCRDLARGGPGSLDVVEIDAASHNGVDDARELRDRAAFASARDRFKIFILDEAHMVSTQGFNALLKLVEEPPDHVKFIFATTEPEKVIGTIRSRTHHYPFRLVPPEKLLPYLEQICAAEGVQVGSGVFPLVVRAGAGSVRDSLSVLDQLLAGADGVLDYAQAVALLGYTPATLLDDAVEALAGADGAAVFRVVDRVMESGHEPRRFVEDLLQRLRDLIVVVAAGERAADALRGVPEDQFARMRHQAEHLGLAQLSRAADLTNSALTEMTGATSPRLHLELLCARLLLPAADEPVRGYGARIERLEQRMAAGVPVVPAGPAPVVVPASVAEHPSPTAWPEPDQVWVERSAARSQPTEASAPPAPTPTVAHSRPARPVDTPQPGSAAVPSAARPAAPVVPAPAVPAPAVPAPAVPAPAVPAAGLDTETVRRRWPEVLETLSRLRRGTWVITTQNAQVATLEGTVLRLRFDTPGIATTFRNGPHAALVEQAVRETLGLDVKIQAVADDGAPSGSASSPGAPARRGTGRPGGDRSPADAPPADGVPDHAARAAADWASAAPASVPRATPSGGAERAPREAGVPEAAPAPPAPVPGPAPEEAAASSIPPRPDVQAIDKREPIPAARRAPRLEDVVPPEPEEWVPAFEDEPDFDDPDIEDSSLIGAPLVKKVLGATLIDEIPLGPGGSSAPGAP